MPNLSPSNSISLLTTKTKTTNEKHNNQREKRNNQTIFFSNNQTQPISKNSSSPTIKHNNQRETTKSTNARPTWGFVWIGSHRFCWSCWDRIRLDQSCWSWLDQISGSLSLCLVPYLSFPTEAHLGFARVGSDLGFTGVEFCLNKKIESNRLELYVEINFIVLNLEQWNQV